MEHEHILSGIVKCPVCGTGMCGMVNRYQKEMSGLNRQAITGHERLNEDVAVTTYADGTKVYVNYGTEEFKQGSVTVPGRDYLVKRGDGQ